MIPPVVKISKFRKGLFQWFKSAKNSPIIVKDAEDNEFVLTLASDYNRLSSFEKTFQNEDPEGEYSEKFITEMKDIKGNQHDIDTSVSSMKDLL